MSRFLIFLVLAVLFSSVVLVTCLVAGLDPELPPGYYLQGPSA